MHTITVIGSGFLLLLVMVVATRLMSSEAAARAAAAWFILIWFAVAAINMWVGVSRAGYSVAEEAPIFLLIFALPTVVAVIVRRFV
jgi:hypothetical protein